MLTPYEMRVRLLPHFGKVPWRSSLIVKVASLKNGGTCNDDKGAAGRRGNIGHCFRSSNHCGCSVGFSAEVICKLRSSVQALVQGDHGPTAGEINGGLARPTHRPGGARKSTRLNSSP